MEVQQHYLDLLCFIVKHKNFSISNRNRNRKRNLVIGSITKTYPITLFKIQKVDWGEASEFMFLKEFIFSLVNIINY